MQVVRWHHYDFLGIYTDHCKEQNRKLCMYIWQCNTLFTQSCLCLKISLHSLHAYTVVSANSLWVNMGNGSGDKFNQRGKNLNHV